MNTDLLQVRESEIFKTLKELNGRKFVVIGGYAVNAYAPPRFSVDCDIVIKDKNEIGKVEDKLLDIGYRKAKHPAEFQYSGNFQRHEKDIEKNFSVSIDILIGKVTDRDTGAIFNADWIFENSNIMKLNGKTIIEKLDVRIISHRALMAMKIVSCRPTDIRDVFMMAQKDEDSEWIRHEVGLRTPFDARILKIIDKVSSKQFKDGLSGVYGRFDIETFERHKKALDWLAKG